MLVCHRHILWCAVWVALLTACAQQKVRAPLPASAPATLPSLTSKPNSAAPGLEVALYALSLVETGYRFGGKNPEAGLDCSGMVSYVYRQAVGLALQGSAADLARLGRPVTAAELKPGDLVFFNTRGRPYSHVGIYIGDDRFVHAPSSGGAVRTDSLRSGWYAARFEGGRTFFD